MYDTCIIYIAKWGMNVGEQETQSNNYHRV